MLCWEKKGEEEQPGSTQERRGLGGVFLLGLIRGKRKMRMNSYTIICRSELGEEGAVDMREKNSKDASHSLGLVRGDGKKAWMRASRHRMGSWGKKKRGGWVWGDEGDKEKRITITGDIEKKRWRGGGGWKKVWSIRGVIGNEKGTEQEEKSAEIESKAKVVGERVQHHFYYNRV